PSWQHTVGVLPDAAAIAIVQFVSAVSMAELLGRKRRLRVDARQEMLAYGVSSVVGSFFQCIPTGSAVARSIILKDVGGQTQVLHQDGMPRVATRVSQYSISPLTVARVDFETRVLANMYPAKNLTAPEQCWVWARTTALAVFWPLRPIVYVRSLALLTCFNSISAPYLYNKSYLTNCSSSFLLQHDDVVVFRFGSPLCFANHKNMISGFEDIFREAQPEKPLFIDETRTLKSAKAIVLDCSAITFIDSVGLSALNVVAETCTVNKCLLFLASLPS
ncbi:unnamed protein product, partial [Ixodes hexagonus]